MGLKGILSRTGCFPSDGLYDTLRLILWCGGTAVDFKGSHFEKKIILWGVRVLDKEQLHYGT
jgi:hypothetical protein